MGALKPYFLLLFTWTLSLFLILGNGAVPAQAQITTVEVNQALGTQKDNHKYYVAGKNTVVRAFLNETVMIDGSRSLVKVFRNGQPAFDIAPKTTAQPVSTLDFLCDSMQACGNWVAGTYTFQVYVNGLGRSFVSWYYRISPPIADFIAGKDALRALVRIMLLPAVAFSALALRIGLFWSLVIMLALLALAAMAASILIRRPRRRA